MAFRIGERVVCVDADGASELKRGAQYTVAGRCSLTKQCQCKDGTHPRGVLLCEVAPPPDSFCSFLARRFRPLIERKTSTGFEILDDIRKRESETTRAPRRATV